MTSRRCRSLVASLALALLAGVPSLARAEATADQRAAAQALFDDARRLMSEKRYADACPKLEESQRLDPGLGTLLNLAECQVQTGRTASAWANFLEAAYQAKAAGQGSRERTARTRAAALEPSLARLTILAVASDNKVEIRRDGATVASSLIGTAVPVDPGEHVVSVSAPGKKPWETRVTIKGDGQQVTVSVPQLEEAAAEPKPPPPLEVKPPPPPEVKPHRTEPSPPPPPPEPVAEGDPGRGLRAAGVVLTILGLGGLGTGAGFTFLAKNKLDSSNMTGGCVGNLCPAGQPFDDRTTARRDGNIATGAFIGGGVVLATGMGLLIAASSVQSKPSRRATIAPVVAAAPGRGAWSGLSGRF